MDIKKTAAGLHIDGIPDAVHLVRLDGPEAKYISDLALHRSDLEFAAECLAEINRQRPEALFPREALLRCAIVQFGKCFGRSASRSRLDFDVIYGADKEGLEIYEYFKSLRDKNIVHDENPLSRAIPCAALNDGSKAYKVEKILTLSVLIQSLESASYSNLSLLISTALEWVVNQYEVTCEKLTKSLEAESYQNLRARPTVTYNKPMVDDVHLRR